MGYLKWLGHATFEIEIDGVKVFLDPWIENPLSPIRLENVDRADLVLVTHDHSDHLGNTVDIAKKTGAKIVAIFDICEEIKNKHPEIDCVDLNIGSLVEIKGLKIGLTLAFHSSLHGHPVGFIVKGGETTIYHAGDTSLFKDMELIGELYRPEIALLPIGGWYTMGPYEAAYAVKLIKPKVAIPMHYYTFPVIKGSPEEFKKHVEELYPATRVVILKPGEKFEF